VPSAEALLEVELQLNANQLWLNSWHPLVRRHIAAELAAALDLNSKKVTASRTDLMTRCAARRLKPGPELQDECADLLLRELPRLNAAVQGGRYTRRGLAHWEGGDLAAQIQRLSRALEEFVQLPDEG